MPIPPRATSSSNSYGPKARGRTPFTLVDSGPPSSGPPPSTLASRPFVHSPRGASGDSPRPHLGQTVVAGKADIKRSLSIPIKKQIRPNLSWSLRRPAQLIAQRGQQVTNLLL